MGVPIRGFNEKGGAAGTHVRAAPVIIMANDVSIIQLDASEYAGNFVLPDTQVDHGNLRRRVLENHRQKNKGFCRASHRFIDVPSESLAEGMAGEATDRKPVFDTEVFQRVVDILFGIRFQGFGVAYYRLPLIGRAEQFIERRDAPLYVFVERNLAGLAGFLFDLIKSISFQDILPCHRKDIGYAAGGTERDAAVKFPEVVAVLVQRGKQTDEVLELQWFGSCNLTFE